MASNQHYVDVSRFFKTTRSFGDQYEQLNFVFGIINSVRTNSIRIRSQMKNEGLLKGVPDICLPFKSADEKFPIMWIEHKTLDFSKTTGSEIKSSKSYLRPEQRKFKEFVEKQGHKFVTTYCLEDLINELQNYLNIDLETTLNKQTKLF